jgi:hypothetical protein
MTIETIQTWLPIIKDIVTILATAVAAIVAISGYQTWKKQLHWRTQYELAQRLLRATYRTREAFSRVRSATLSEDERFQAKTQLNSAGEHTFGTTEPSSGEEDLSDKPGGYQYWNIAYRRRLLNAEEAFIELRSVSLEAEAIWGTVAKENMYPLLNCVLAYTHMANSFLNKPNHWLTLSTDWSLRILFDARDENGNNLYTEEIKAAVAKVENFLKPYLKI